MARTVADAAVLLGVLGGSDENDPATRLAGSETVDYTAYLDSNGLKGARIGVPRQVYHKWLTDEEKGLFETLLKELASAGACLVDPADIPSAEELSKFRSHVLRYEFKANLNAYLGKLPPAQPVHSLKELIAFNETHSEQALKYGQVRLMWAEETSGRLTEPEYLMHRLNDIQLSRQEGIDRVITEYRLDALIFPKDYGESIAAKAGYPSIAVPGGYLQDGRPFGVMFTAGAFSEPMLIKLAYAFEQLRPRRKPPVLGAI